LGEFYPELANHLLLCFTELVSRAAIDRLVEVCRDCSEVRPTGLFVSLQLSVNTEPALPRISFSTIFEHSSTRGAFLLMEFCMYAGRCRGHLTIYRTRTNDENYDYGKSHSRSSTARHPQRAI
jgi:hypothetical protein